MSSLFSLLRAWLRPANTGSRPRSHSALRVETLEGRTLLNGSPITAGMADHGREAQRREVEPRNQMRIDWGRVGAEDQRQEDRQADRRQDNQAQPQDQRREDRQVDRQEQQREMEHPIPHK